MSGVPSSNLVNLRPVALVDLPDVALVHLEAFPRSALTQLGREAVRRYYEWQYVGPHDHHFVVAELGGEIMGFCVGGISRGALGGFLAAHRSFLVWRLLTRPWLVLNPIVARKSKFARRLMRFGRTQSVHPPVTKVTPASYGILSIAVSPRCQGRGVAQRLMTDSEDDARRRGYAHMHLTVATDNHRAVRFYEKMGWRKSPNDGAWNGHMEKALGDAGEAGERAGE